MQGRVYSTRSTYVAKRFSTYFIGANASTWIEERISETYIEVVFLIPCASASRLVVVDFRPWLFIPTFEKKLESRLLELSPPSSP
jgi:hypothetical protein